MNMLHLNLLYNDIVYYFSVDCSIHLSIYSVYIVNSSKNSKELPLTAIGAFQQKSEVAC